MRDYCVEFPVTDVRNRCVVAIASATIDRTQGLDWTERLEASRFRRNACNDRLVTPCTLITSTMAREIYNYAVAGLDLRIVCESKKSRDDVLARRDRGIDLAVASRTEKALNAFLWHMEVFCQVSP